MSKPGEYFDGDGYVYRFRRSVLGALVHEAWDSAEQAWLPKPYFVKGAERVATEAIEDFLAEEKREAEREYVEFENPWDDEYLYRITFISSKPTRVQGRENGDESWTEYPLGSDGIIPEALAAAYRAGQEEGQQHTFSATIESFEGEQTDCTTGRDEDLITETQDAGGLGDDEQNLL